MSDDATRSLHAGQIVVTAESSWFEKLGNALFWRRKVRSTFARTLKNALTGLLFRLRKRWVDDVVERALTFEPDLATLWSESPSLQRSSMAILLQRAVSQWLDENRRAELELSSLLRQLERAVDEESQLLIIKGYLREHAASWWGYLGDVWALSRRMEVDALRERTDEIRHRNFARIEVAVAGFAHLWLEGRKHCVLDPRAFYERVREARPTEFLYAVTLDNPRWPTRLMAAEKLFSLLLVKDLGTLAVEQVQKLMGVARDVYEHPWLRRNCLRCVAVIDPPYAFAYMREALEVPGNQEGEFLFRMLILDDTSRRAAIHDDARALVLAHFARGDTSEHVRIRIAEYLGRFSCTDEALLEAILHRLSPGDDEKPCEASSKARAMILRSVGTQLRGCVVERSGELEVSNPFERLDEIFLRWANLLRKCLMQDTDELVLRSICLEIAQSAELIARTQLLEPCAQALGMWVSALTWLRSAPARSFKIHEEAAAALERVLIAMRPVVMAAYDEVDAIVQSMKRGTSQVVAKRGALAEVSRESLGRIAAQLSRRDWGIYIEESARHFKIQRAEQMKTRLWRIWHEVKTPMPNKRQAFVHSTGRHYQGRLRAHPGRLDEVTPTVVPGERITVDSEGGWGRHLPLIDDILGRPLPSQSRPVEVYSSLGVTRIVVRGNWLVRRFTRMRLQFAYAKLADLRRQSLLTDDKEERGQYIKVLRETYGVEIDFAMHGVGGHLSASEMPESVQRLFARPKDGPLVPGSANAKAAAWIPFLGDPQIWLTENAHYFLSDAGNDQLSLSIFLVAILGYFLVDGYRRRRSVRRARTAIPLSVGGWGTRGKSGTERLKAAVFHGLGYRVFSKTTGCEAMLIHSVAEGPPSEIFVFRPYGKATIWEQRDLLELAAKLKADVFLWECMALNPSYVSILQHGWMRDDVTTLTNAYPDHEDIQGPAGINVADVISRFIPRKSVVVCSEMNFLPIMRDVAKRQQSEFIALEDDASEWVGEDFLELFPYQEHPRNIALVASMSEYLGVERDLAILNMAQYVVPDLGVLKTYGDIRARGRIMRFVNGCSANERTGFMNNWRRTGCIDFDADRDPGKVVITVVNNRDDRISRSEVFSRILVQDAATDRNVLIGTNLRGLLGYIDDALHEHLDAVRVATARDFEGGVAEARKRFEKLMRRHRAPSPVALKMRQRFAIYAAGAGMHVNDVGLSAIESVVQALLEAAAKCPAQLVELRAWLKKHAELKSAMQDALTRHSTAKDSREIPECMEPATAADVEQHFIRQLSRLLCIHRQRVLLEKALESKSAALLDKFHIDLKERYIELFKDGLDVVEDPGTKGDQIIDRCARSVPPGTDLTIMGTQNIKGTGLDFVYRWVSLGAVMDLLKRVQSENMGVRSDAIAQLEAYGDHGVIDLGILRGTIPGLVPKNDDEKTAYARLLSKVEVLHKKKIKGLAVVTDTKKDYIASVLHWVEGWLEFLDGARRFHQSRSLSDDLAKVRVSHAKAAIEMRDLYARTKGGWLAKKFGR